MAKHKRLKVLKYVAVVTEKICTWLASPMVQVYRIPSSIGSLSIFPSIHRTRHAKHTTIESNHHNIQNMRTSISRKRIALYFLIRSLEPTPSRRAFWLVCIYARICNVCGILNIYKNWNDDDDDDDDDVNEDIDESDEKKKIWRRKREKKKKRREHPMHVLFNMHSTRNTREMCIEARACSEYPPRWYYRRPRWCARRTSIEIGWEGGNTKDEMKEGVRDR